MVEATAHAQSRPFARPGYLFADAIRPCFAACYSFLRNVHSFAPSPLLLAGDLSGFSADMFVDVFDALALVRFGLS